MANAMTATLPNSIADHLAEIKDSMSDLLKTTVSEARAKKNERTNEKVKTSDPAAPKFSTMSDTMGLTKSLSETFRKSMPDFASMMKPGGLIKAAGLGLDSPAIMMLGDAMNGVQDKIKESIAANAGEQDKIKNELRTMGVSRAQANKILGSIKDLSSADGAEMHRILLNNGVTNQSALDAIISQKKQFEDGLMFRNPDMVSLLEEQGKDNDAIIKELRAANTKGIWDEKQEKDRQKVFTRMSNFLGEQSDSLKSLLGITKKEDGGSGFGLKFLALIGLGVGGFVGGFVETLQSAYKPFTSLFKSLFGKDSKIISALRKMWSGTFGKLIARFTKFTTTLAKSSKLFARLMPLASGLGKLVGKIVLPLQMAYEIIKGWINADSIRDKLLGASAGIMSVILEIPEMIANGLMSLFGSELRFDFSSDKIIESVNHATDWVFNNITVPVGDFFFIDIPNYFNKVFEIFNSFKQKIVDGISYLKDTATSLIEKVDVFDWFGSDDEESSIKPRSTASSSRRGRGSASIGEALQAKRQSNTSDHVVDARMIADREKARKSDIANSTTNNSQINANTINNIQNTDMTTRVDTPSLPLIQFSY